MKENIREEKKDIIAIVNGKVFDGLQFLEDKVILISDGKILDLVDKKIFNAKKLPTKQIDVKGNYVVPGFIDLQLNGCGGVLFNDDISEKTLKVMHQTNLKYGCTSFAPTLITTTDENIKKAIKLMESLPDKESFGVLGLHIEGPYISKEKRGVHNPKYIRSLDSKMLDFICKAGKKSITILTLAPENVHGEDISKLAASGIKVSLGHTNGTYNEIINKRPHGISLATHLFNAMTQFAHREPGVVGAVFNSDIKAGIIPDGFHVEYSSIQIAKKIMGERLFLVTDAVSPAGTDMKSFMFEGQKVFHKDGKCFTEEGTLGGSALTMIQGIRNLVNHVRLTLEEAIRMATIYPAVAASIDDSYGKLQPGYIANIVVMNSELEISNVFSHGEIHKIKKI
ncbi:MAG: N-acetylglucosamine-6-phosphate deacetylase [Fusobacteriaceae bacterium]